MGWDGEDHAGDTIVTRVVRNIGHLPCLSVYNNHAKQATENIGARTHPS